MGIGWLGVHHEESHGVGLQVGSLERKSNVPFLHAGHRVISIPVSWSMSSWVDFLVMAGGSGLRPKSWRHLARRALAGLARKPKWRIRTNPRGRT